MLRCRKKLLIYLTQLSHFTDDKIKTQVNVIVYSALYLSQFMQMYSNETLLLPFASNTNIYSMLDFG